MPATPAAPSVFDLRAGAAEITLMRSFISSPWTSARGDTKVFRELKELMRWDFGVDLDGVRLVGSRLTVCDGVSGAIRGGVGAARGGVGATRGGVGAIR